MYNNYIVGIVIIVLLVTIIFYKFYETYKNAKSTENLTDGPVVSNEPQLIPKIIIQTWKTADVPPRYQPLVDSIKSNNPDYKYMFFTDSDIETFLKTHYIEYYQTYAKLPIKIQRIDFFRYIAVYHYGGFYMDLDMDCLKSFDGLLHHSCVFPIDEYISKQMGEYPRYKSYSERGYNYLLGQYAFAAEPQNPFIKSMIDKIHNNINKYIKNVNFDSHDYVYKTTGPDFCTDLYIDYPDKVDILVLNNNKRQYFGDYAKHNYFGTWK